ncbi:hypothetical protein K438DRAFT_1910255 [Mycena galopus ATCC 62051]|nr:hypothetical protein K438DRAFT_1910255 [Mycena galopus ATCC 62051]
MAEKAAPSPLRTSFSISDNNSEVSSSVPSTPEPNEKRRKNYRSGYETAPRSSPYTPYKLNNPVTQKCAPLELDNPTLLANRDSLDPEEWNKIAISHKIIPAGASLHSFQISAANLALSQRNDAVVISATGSGKSLTWVLPLLARQTRISLVITPYTSLGLDGELLGNYNGVSSIFIQSERNKDKDFQKALNGQMLVVFVCPEMLESPRLQALSAIYINKAHLVKQTHHWRLPYSRLYRLREIVGLDILLSFRDALVVYAGMRSDYLLVNFGSFRPELSTIVFLNIASVMPLGQPESQLVKTLIYCDDLELLTKIAASMGYSEYVVDILHAGLSNRHETIALQSFRDGTTLILLGSSKISAGMNFPGVRRVVQYKCRDLTLLHFDQRRGRGARQPGETSVTILLVEPTMYPDASTSQNLHNQDPGMVELLTSQQCILDDCCNRCNPELPPPQQYRWVTVDPKPVSKSVIYTPEVEDLIFEKLSEWRMEHWKQDWMAKWPRYGPSSLISHSDLEEIAKHAAKIISVEDLQLYTHIIHWDDISGPLFAAFELICAELKLEVPHTIQPATPGPIPLTTAVTSSQRKTSRKKQEKLQIGEMIVDF